MHIEKMLTVMKFTIAITFAIISGFTPWSCHYSCNFISRKICNCKGFCFDDPTFCASNRATSHHPIQKVITGEWQKIKNISLRSDEIVNRKLKNCEQHMKQLFLQRLWRLWKCKLKILTVFSKIAIITFCKQCRLRVRLKCFDD